ncbi:hypothetical protein GY45DRAFT_1375572 [Cubamyces sp. BRFM 1775]|nr:hypothetical protein GY45DRAFT_1375572 [Cubamyces sp. BRFM 1775]
MRSSPPLNLSSSNGHTVKLIVRVQACLYYNRLPEELRLPRGSAEIKKRTMAQMLDDTSTEFMLHSISGKGSPPSPRDPSYKRPVIIPLKSKFRYTIASSVLTGERIKKKAFHGLKRWAELVRNCLGKRKVTAQTVGEKPAYAAAMNRWREHCEAIHIFGTQGWRGRTTYAMFKEWEFNRKAAEAMQVTLDEEEHLSAALSLPSTPTPALTSEPDSNVASDASGETCVPTDDNDVSEDDLMEWSAFINTSLFADKDVIW